LTGLTGRRRFKVKSQKRTSMAAKKVTDSFNPVARGHVRGKEKRGKIDREIVQ